MRSNKDPTQPKISKLNKKKKSLSKNKSGKHREQPTHPYTNPSPFSEGLVAGDEGTAPALGSSMFERETGEKTDKHDTLPEAQ